MSEYAAFVRAAQRYGPSLNHVAAKYGISGAALLLKLAKGESGFNMRAVSSAGARGGTQFMPGTRASFLQRYGVDPWRSVDEAVHATAIYLRKSGLAAYNPGDPGYSSYILGQKIGPHSAGSAGGTSGTVTTTTTQGPQVHTDKLAALRDALLSGSKNPLISAAQGVASGRYDSTTPGRQQITTTPLGETGKGGSAKLAAGADRAGVRTNPAVLKFARVVSAIAGVPLTIGTGTNHSRMTVDGNVSDHWSGHAADIPATGQHLIHLGQAALIAAGMSPAQARKQHGGLYNVHGHQIIFNTMQGGNHTNHLHISAY